NSLPWSRRLCTLRSWCRFVRLGVNCRRLVSSFRNRFGGCRRHSESFGVTLRCRHRSVQLRRWCRFLLGVNSTLQSSFSGIIEPFGWVLVLSFGVGDSGSIFFPPRACDNFVVLVLSIWA
ncbi:12642_t:CDS:2, partial [Gigaspora rosea]